MVSNIYLRSSKWHTEMELTSLEGELQIVFTML
jgi:hypothetical protein